MVLKPFHPANGSPGNSILRDEQMPINLISNEPHAERGHCKEPQTWSAEARHCRSSDRSWIACDQFSLSIEAIQDARGYTRAPVKTLTVTSASVRPAGDVVQRCEVLPVRQRAGFWIKGIGLDDWPS